jgi:hypothetical protein
LNNTQAAPDNDINPDLKRSSRAYFIYYVATQAAFDRGIFILFLLSQGFYALYGFAMSLISGGDRSLIYDTFKQHNKEASFIKLETLSRSIGSIVLGLAIILGGVL